MAVSTIVPNSFKDELLKGVHYFGTSNTCGPAGDQNVHAFKLALYKSAASLSKSTTAYSATNEVSSSGTGYTTGGISITSVANNAAGSNSDVASADWNNAVFSSLTCTTGNGNAIRYGLIYNDTVSGDPAVLVIDFGADQEPNAADFTVTLPATGTGTVRIS